MDTFWKRRRKKRKEEIRERKKEINDRLIKDRSSVKCSDLAHFQSIP